MFDNYQNRFGLQIRILKLFIYKNPKLYLGVVITLAFLGFLIVYPIFGYYPFPIALSKIVIISPISVIPGKEYSFSVRAINEHINFNVSENNYLVIIKAITSFNDPTLREKITFEAAAPPSIFSYFSERVEFKILIDGNRIPVILKIPLDVLSMPIRLFFGFIFTSPAIYFIFPKVLKRAGFKK